MTIDVVLDANVLVSAHISRQPGSAPFQAYSAMFGPGVQNHISEKLLAEFSRVMRRPGIAARHGMRPTEIEELAARIATASLAVSAPRSLHRAPDPDHQHLWDMLAAFGDLILVTGDRLLLESGDFPGRVITPRQFVERYLDEVGAWGR